MLTDRYSDAFTYAAEAHRTETRKGTNVPYVAHVMAVSAMVLEHGGSEDAAVAALLHDCVEDHGGLARAREIAQQFGSHVAALVMACTDSPVSDGEAKPPWLERKIAFVEHLPEIAPEAALIVTCDKIHNLRALLRDLRREGPTTLRRFNRPEALGWYFTALGEALRPFAAIAPVDELRALAREFVAEAPAQGRRMRPHHG